MTLTLASKRRDPALLESFDASFASFEEFLDDRLENGDGDGGNNDSLTNFGDVFGTSLAMKSKSDLFSDLEADESHTNLDPELFLSKLNLLFDACDFDDYSPDGGGLPQPEREASLADLDFLNNQGDDDEDTNQGSSTEALFTSFEDFQYSVAPVGKALQAQGENRALTTLVKKTSTRPRPRRSSRLTPTTAGGTKAAPPRPSTGQGSNSSEEPKKERAGNRSKRLASSRRENPPDAPLDARLLKAPVMGKVDSTGDSRSSKENDRNDDLERAKSQRSLVSDSSKNSAGDRRQARPRHRSTGAAPAPRGRSRSLTSGSRHPPLRGSGGAQGRLATSAADRNQELGTSSHHSAGRAAPRRRSISLGAAPRVRAKSRTRKAFDPLTSLSTHSSTRRRPSRRTPTGPAASTAPTPSHLGPHRSPPSVASADLWSILCLSGQAMDAFPLEATPVAGTFPTGQAPKRAPRVRRPIPVPL